MDNFLQNLWNFYLHFKSTVGRCILVYTVKKEIKKTIHRIIYFKSTVGRCILVCTVKKEIKKTLHRIIKNMTMYKGRKY